MRRANNETLAVSGSAHYNESKIINIVSFFFVRNKLLLFGYLRILYGVSTLYKAGINFEKLWITVGSFNLSFSTPSNKRVSLSMQYLSFSTYVPCSLKAFSTTISRSL